MKKQIYLYLFLITALILLFVIVNNKNEAERLTAKVEHLESKFDDVSKKYQDTIETLRIEAIELGEFTFKEDAYSQEHLYKEGYDVESLESTIEDTLISLNTEEGGNPLVPFAPMMSDKMLVNKVKMLNYKWVLADFTDGKYWGQMVLKCNYNDDKTITFNAVDSFLYPIDVID